MIRLSASRWLETWIGENDGLCRICNAAVPTAEPLQCPTGCDVPAAFARGGWASSSERIESLQPASAPVTVRSLRELLADPELTRPPKFIIPGLVEAGAVTLLSGAPKAGKSTFASQLAADLSSGRPALDGSPMPAARVLWIAIDEPLVRLVRRLPLLNPDIDRFRIHARSTARLTPALFAQVVAQEDPVFVVLDTLSQLAADNGIKPNDPESVAPFIKALVDVIHGRPHCGALFLFHAPHHARRAAGSVQWGAVVDAPLVLRRPEAAALRPGESPDDDIDIASGEDGRRILEGITRWGGEVRMQLSYRDGHYQLGAGASPLIERVRWYLANTEPGPGKTSAACLARVLKVREASVGTVIHELLSRGEVRAVGEGRKRFIERNASMSLYLGSDSDVVGCEGETIREVKEEKEPSFASQTQTPVFERGKRKRGGRRHREREARRQARGAMQ